MNQIDDHPTVKRAKIFLADHGLQKESCARRICLFMLDLSLLAGFGYYCYIIDDDWDYWQTSPYPFHAFIIV